MNPPEKSREPDTEPQLHPASPGDDAGAEIFPVWPPAEGTDKIKIGKAVALKDPAGSEVGAVFTMTLGSETIQLVPLKHWTQLDTFKWRARGLLPHTPAGLEITWDHVKVAGETVAPGEPDACAKLEKAFNGWLAMEQKALEVAKAKTQTQKPGAQSQDAPADHVVHFQVEMGRLGQPQLKCMEGRRTVETVALNAQGVNALVGQGLMRKPHSVKAGALRDWIELDGQLFRFKDGTNWAKELESFLNERYLANGDPATAGDVAVFENPASPTGFDVQFPAAPTGIVENRKRHLNAETLELLGDSNRCHVLRRGILVKLAPPHLVFKRQTADGGEDYLEPGPESTVYPDGDDGLTRVVDLSQPVDLLKVGIAELKAIFNHPAVNRRAHFAQIAEADRNRPPRGNTQVPAQANQPRPGAQ